MLQKLLHITCSLWLAALLLFGGTAKDFIHQFASHEDTVHSKQAGRQGPVMEQTHHHCAFLDFQLMPFEAAYQLPFVPFAKCADFISHTVLVAARTGRTALPHVSLRGPPAPVV